MLIANHNRLLGGLDRLDWIVPSLARFAFAAVLLRFFWASAATKLDGIFSPSAGAYIQIFPKKMEALGYDLSQFSTLESLIVLMGTYAEFILPALIVAGLTTRLAAIGMTVFILVMSYVDITGHGADANTIGSWFDNQAYALIMDQRLLWITLLLTLLIKGAGPASLDRLIGVK